MATVTSATNHFPTAKEGFTTTLASSVASAATTVPLNSVSGYNNGDVVCLVVDPTSATAKQVFTGIVDTSGVQITSVVWTEGTNQVHSSGATVVDYETATAWALQAKGLLVAHSQDGTHKSGLVLPSPTITGTATGTYTLGGTVTVTTPTIASFTNATHTHQNAAGGGTLDARAMVNPYKFRVSQNGAASTGNGAFAAIAFDTEQFDSNNNVAAGVYTVPVTGFYWFAWGGNTTMGGANRTFLMSLFVNGSERSRGIQDVSANSSDVFQSNGSDMLSLTAGDTVDVRAFGTATLSLNVGNTYQNFFAGRLVSV